MLPILGAGHKAGDRGPRAFSSALDHELPAVVDRAGAERGQGMTIAIAGVIAASADPCRNGAGIDD